MLRRLNGLKALVHDAIDHATELVDEGHESASRAARGLLTPIAPLRAPVEAVDHARRVVTRATLASVRAVNHLVREVTDAGIALAASTAEASAEDDRSRTVVPLRSDAVKSAPWVADAALGALNGAIGHHLAARDNELALNLSLRVGDLHLGDDPEGISSAVSDALERPTGSIVVLIHGLATTEWSWSIDAARNHGDPAANFGTLLARDMDFTPVFARYNTGRHISDSAADLSDAIERLVSGWPVPVARVVLVGHSMGGLVARAAAHHGDRSGAAWRARLTHVACLGSPHEGAPLEKLGVALTAALLAVDLPATRVLGRLLQGRSDGIKDLRHGSLLEEDWRARDPDALSAAPPSPVDPLPNVAYCFVSATVTTDPRHPVGTILGDLLVRHPSAQGAALRERTFAIRARHVGGVLHHELQNHPDVYAQLADFLSA
jgi:pimeloyl-ACP methyl ester carboxylesterase